MAHTSQQSIQVAELRNMQEDVGAMFWSRVRGRTILLVNLRGVSEILGGLCRQLFQ